MNKFQLERESSFWLKHIEVKNFRSCVSTDVKLQPGLTLLVGENNAGKSNIIDALRLALPPKSGRRTRYFEASDSSRSTDGNPRIDLTFADPTDFQKGLYIGALDLQNDNLRHTVEYQAPSSGQTRGRVSYLAGNPPGIDPEPEVRQRINHVYLEPLRDAQRELDSGNGRRLSAVMEFLLTDKEKTELIDKSSEKQSELAQEPGLVKVSSAIQGHLSSLTDPVLEQTSDLQFDSPTIENLARGLRLKMGDAGIDPGDLAETGLGYANLLFMSTILIELQNSKDADLTILLVEEPEAHLHPQLQAVFLDYLQEKADESAKKILEVGEPAGRIQVIATTHSPNLASSIGSKNVVVVRRTDAGTAALSLVDVKLTVEERRKIDQYLDVTRSELLFTRRVLLVEGITEALLLPALAEECVYDQGIKEQNSLLKKFRAASIVTLGSVDFSPYLTLLLHDFGDGLRLADGVAVLTDQDPDLSDESTEVSPTGYVKKKGERRAGLDKLVNELGGGEQTLVQESPYTMEASLLAGGANNRRFMKRAYLKQHPRSADKWESIERHSHPAKKMYELMDSKVSGNLDLRKGEFIHDLIIEFSKKHENQDGEHTEIFQCPPHLESVIRFVAGERNESQ